MIDPFVDFFGLDDVATITRKLCLFCLVGYPVAAILCSLVLGGEKHSLRWPRLQADRLAHATIGASSREPVTPPRERSRPATAHAGFELDSLFPCRSRKRTKPGILAAAESWPFMSGFVLALGELTATRVTSGPSVPQTTGGTVVGLILGIVAMMFLGVVIAVGSVPLLGFGLTFDKAPLLRKMPFLLNSEQKKTMLVKVVDVSTTKSSKVMPQ
jgi:hypothetical protein